MRKSLKSSGATADTSTRTPRHQAVRALGRLTPTSEGSRVKTLNTTLLNVIVLASIVATTASAQAPESPRPLVVTAENMSALAAAVPRTGDARVLRPGDVVRYRLTFTNTTPDSVRNVQFSDHVPAGLKYVSGSATSDRPDVLIEFSIDGGRSYSATPEIDVVENGKRVRHPAPPETYTDVRWTGRGWVRARAQVTSEFRLQLAASSVAARN